MRNVEDSRIHSTSSPTWILVLETLVVVASTYYIVRQNIVQERDEQTLLTGINAVELKMHSPRETNDPYLYYWYRSAKGKEQKHVS